MRPFVVVAALALVACGGGLERVSFVTDQLEYSGAARVMLSVTNAGDAPVGVNLCVSTLVREDGTTPGPSDGATCTLELEALEPRAREEERKQLPAALTTGRWRYATVIELSTSQRETVLTPVFVVK